MSKKSHSIDQNTLREWLEQDCVCLVDVREPYEHVLERIEGSLLCSSSSFSLDRLPKDEKRPFVFYCKTGIRSGKIANLFIEDGPNEAFHLEGGIDSWIDAEFPTEKKKSTVISIERQFQLLLGSLLLLLTLLTLFVHSGFIWGIAFIASGLLFAGTTGICGLTILISKLPYNHR